MELPLEDSLRLVTTPLLGRLKGERTVVKPDTGTVTLVTLEDGSFLNLVNGTPDASELYCVAWNKDDLLWEGWLSSEIVEDISENPFCMPCETRLPIIEVLKRSVLAKGKEDWENEKSAVVVEPGELYHIRTWRDGWAYATALKESYLPSELDHWEKCRCSGWVPIYVLELVGSTMSELVENLEQEKLDESAVQILDLKSGSVIVKGKIFAKRYGCVFRESGEELQGQSTKRFYFDSPSPTYCLDFESHDNLVTARAGTPPDGRLGVREPRNEKLVVLYEEKGGKISRLWLRPDVENLGGDPEAGEEEIMASDIYKEFEAKLREYFPQLPRHPQCGMRCRYC